MQPLSIREKAIQYRKRGYSYGMIKEILGLPKSTQSNWFKEIPYSPNKEVLQRIGAARSKSARYKNQQKLNDIKLAKNRSEKEVGELTDRDLAMLGTALYLGEGSKSTETVQIANSDPKVIQLAMKWLEKTFGLKKRNFVLSLYLYPDSNVEESIEYWAKITGIPKGYFTKTQIDKRQNKSVRKNKKLPHGTARLTVKSLGEKEFGVRLHRRIMGWIEASLNQI